jgi:PncC family amidohydrolase
VPPVTDLDIPHNLPASEAAILLLQTGMTVATAESCTGGLLAGALTDVPGSSAYFVGGVVSYDNKVKLDLLNVPSELIEAHGAVSAEVAAVMAESVCALIGADIGISVTGIAGPSGATPGKPVGTTYVALSSEFRTVVQHFHFGLDRSGNRASSVEAALSMLTAHLSALASGSEQSAIREGALTSL